MYNPKAIKHYDEGRGLQQAGNLAAAERAYNKAIKVNANFVEAYINLGNVLLDRGRPREAGGALRKALKFQPKHPLVLNNLGNALQLQGEYSQAVDWFSKAVAADPGFAGAHSNLGNALRDLGRYDDAIAAYQRAIDLDPLFADSYCNLGIAFSDAGELEQAKLNFERALAINAGHGEAHYGLGNVLHQEADLEQAIQAYLKAVELNPGHANACNALGNVLSEQGEKAQAIAAYHKALAIDPGHQHAYNGLGNALSDQGELDKAMASYRQAIAINPKHKDAYLGLGNALIGMGEIDQGIAAYRQAIKINPQHAEVYRTLSKNKKFTEQDTDLVAMETLYADPALADAQKMQLAFGLGKAYEDLGEHEKAMEFILQATRLKRASYDYDISEDRALFDNIKATFSAEFFAAHENMGNPDPTPIFILGMPRSGTSLVEQILASHPEVYGAGELNDLANFTRQACAKSPGGDFPLAISGLDSEALEGIASQYLAALREHSATDRHITDKMPHNFLYIGLIKLILPGARIIHCRRDAMDVCLSIFKNYFSSAHRYSYHQTELGHYYNLYTDLMAYWKVLLPDFIYDISYEALIADQESESRALLEYCNLPWDEACLEFHNTRRKVLTASSAQVRRPIYRDSVKLWKRYEQQLQPLRDALKG